MISSSTTAQTGGSGGFNGFFAVVAIFIIIGGIVQAIKPDLAWRMSRWQYKDKAALEPSAAGLMAARVSGAVVAVAGIVILVIGLNH